jgi:hypothetical protein
LYFFAGNAGTHRVEKPSWKVAVVMQRRPTKNPYAGDQWEAVRVLSGEASEQGARRIQAVDGMEEWVYPGHRIVLRRDEAEGYYLNVSTGDARVFVMWRMEDDRAVPAEVSASYNEASTWMDAGEQVDPVSMDAPLSAWVGEYVKDNYRPQPRKRIKPQSFVSPKRR